MGAVPKALIGGRIAIGAKIIWGGGEANFGGGDGGLIAAKAHGVLAAAGEGAQGGGGGAQERRVRIAAHISLLSLKSSAPKQR